MIIDFALTSRRQVRRQPQQRRPADGEDPFLASVRFRMLAERRSMTPAQSAAWKGRTVPPICIFFGSDTQTAVWNGIDPISMVAVHAYMRLTSHHAPDKKHSSAGAGQVYAGPWGAIRTDGSAHAAAHPLHGRHACPFEPRAAAGPGLPTGMPLFFIALGI